MRSSIQRAVMTVVSNIQSESGYAASSISRTTRPTKDLEGFDSLVAACASLDLSHELGFNITENMYVFRSREGEDRTIDEIVDHLCEIMQE